MKKIIVMASTYQQAKFFVRLSKVMANMDIYIEAYTIEYSAYRYFKKNDIKAYIPRLDINYKVTKNGNIDYDKTIEVLTRRMDKDQCMRLYDAIYKSIRENHADVHIEGIIIWNGLNVEHRAAADFAHENGIKVLFMELANIPGKLFADRQGTNAHSELFDNINILDKYEINIKEYCSWINDYLQFKKDQINVPQAKHKYTDISVKVLLDVLGYFCITHTGYSRMYIKERLYKLLGNMQSRFKYDTYDYKENKNKYIFLPLQVSYDTQVVINSDISVFESLKYAIKENKVLVVKPHPQESDAWIIKKLLELKNDKDFILVNDNTYNIIENAYSVITINSTVGLEGLLQRKKVQFLGRSFYSKMNDDQLMKYVLGYLINIDFYDENKEISEKEVRRLLNRMN